MLSQHEQNVNILLWADIPPLGNENARIRCNEFAARVANTRAR